MTDLPPALQVGPGTVVLGPVGVAHVRRALEVVAEMGRRDGIGASPALRLLVEVVSRAADDLAMSACGHADVREVGDLPTSAVPDLLSVKEVATMTGLSQRQVRRLTPLLGASKVGSGWAIERHAAEAFVVERAAG